MKNTVALKIRRTKEYRYALVLLLLLCVLNTEAPAAECGRANWSKTPYRYISDYAHHPLLTEATVVRVTSSNRAGKVRIVVVVQSEVSRHYVFTTDQGKNWNPKFNAVPSNLGYVSSWLIQSPSDPHVLYKFEEHSNLYLRSEDGGRFWKLPQYQIDGKTREAFAEEIGGSKDYHIHISLDAIQPKEPKTLFASIAVQRKTPSTDWRNTRFVYQSFDGGEHWTQFSDKLEAFPNSIGSAAAIGINPNSPNIYYGMGEKGLLKSSDSGKTWRLVGQNEDLVKRPLYSSEQQKGSPVMLGAPVGIEIYQFAFNPHEPEITYVVANKGLFKSTDGGQTWRLLDLDFDEIDSINSIGVSPLDGKQLYVGTRYGVFRSDDSGCSFQKIYPPSSKKLNH